MSKKLYFKTALNSGSSKTYSLSEPKSGLSFATARDVFQKAIDKDLFLKDGVKPVSVTDIYYQEVIKTSLL